MRAIRYQDETLGADSVIEEIPQAYREQAREAREKLIEKVSESNDELLEKYLAGAEPAADEIRAALRKRAIESVRGEKAPFVPVICGAAFRNKGVQPLLDAVVDFLPSPVDIPPVVGPRSEQGGGDPRRAAGLGRRPGVRRSSSRS